MSVFWQQLKSGTVGSKIRTFIIRQGKSDRSYWFFLGQDFAIRTVSMETVIDCVFFGFEIRQIQTSMNRVSYNKLLTNLVSSSRSGKYWPSVVFVRSSLRSVRTTTTSGQCSPVSKRLMKKNIAHKFYFVADPPILSVQVPGIKTYIKEKTVD